MQPPIAYTYEADTHCPDCAVARFGREPGYPWPPEDARDSEGNPVGAIAPWDDWCDAEDGPCTLACGTCGWIIATHGPHDTFEDDTARCPACADPIDYCQGHGEIGDPAGAAILAAHDNGDHADCHPSGCDESAARYAPREA